MLCIDITWTSPCSMSCVGIVSSTGVEVSVVNSNLLSWQQPGLPEDFYRNPLDSSIGHNPVLVIRAAFGAKRWPVGIPSP